MNILVYGLGRSGLAVSELVSKQGHTLIAYDQKPKPDEVAQIETLGASLTTKPLETAADICIAAPGVPFDHSDLVALRAKGLETIGEVEWVYRSFNAPIIGITGTAGKGSTTLWLTHVLQAAGLNAVAGGNVDPALSAVVAEERLLIVELSSFQLERCPTLKPTIAIALNLHSDHLDRHGTLSAYHAAKRNLIANQDERDTFIYNADDSKLRTWAAQSSARALDYGFAAHAAGSSRAAYLKDDALYLDNERLVDGNDLQVTGKHQHLNALAVALAARALNVNLDRIRSGLKSFAGVPGRYSEIGRLGEIRFIEDSIATRTLSVKAALEASPAPIVWILGGADKGADLNELSDLVKEKVSLALGVGESGAAFLQQLTGLTKTALCDAKDGETALREACKTAVSALSGSATGGTVLLAPLAASFDQFEDYKDRAAVFRRVVNELLENTSLEEIKGAVR